MTVGEARIELAIAMFAANRLSLGKAAEFSGLDVAAFQMHLGNRRLGPHYDADDAREDLKTLAAFRNA